MKAGGLSVNSCKCAAEGSGLFWKRAKENSADGLARGVSRHPEGLDWFN